MRRSLIDRFDIEIGGIAATADGETAVEHYERDDVVENYDERRRGTAGGQYIRDGERAWIDRLFERDGYDMDADEPLAGVSVADIGGGTGVVSRYLDGTGADVTYLDLSRRMAEEARERSRDGPGADHHVRGDASRLPYRDDAFDYAVSLRTGHVIPDDAFPAYVGELGRITTDGAMFDVFRRPSLRSLYNDVMEMESSLRRDSDVATTIADQPRAALADTENDFVLPYAMFRVADSDLAADILAGINEPLTAHLPDLATVSVWYLDPADR